MPPKRAGGAGSDRRGAGTPRTTHGEANLAPAYASAGAGQVTGPHGRLTVGGRRHAVGLFSRLLDLLLLVLVALYLIALWRQASQASLASDECFHAYVAEWVARHGSLPRELPEFYSGLPYLYPPLFHVLGAAALRLAGPAALPQLNVLLTGALLALLVALPVPRAPRAAGRWAALLCLANSSLSLYAVRVYAEALATLLAVLVIVLLLRLRERPGAAAGVALGLATGAALLAKQPFVLLPVLLGALAATSLARGQRRVATALLVALATGLLVALPFFARNTLLFGSPFQPPLAGAEGRALEAMNARFFSLPPPVFYRNALQVMGPLVPWLAVAALLGSLLRGRLNLAAGLIALALAFVALAPWVPRFQPRHLNPFTAALAMLACLLLCEELRRVRWAGPVGQALLLAWATVFLVRLPEYRAPFNVSPADREVYRAIAEHVPEGATVLSRLTYDTFYYARRNATWPSPWGSSALQIALFTERSPERFLAALERLSIDYFVVPRSARSDRFFGTDYTRSFVACTAALVHAGRLQVLWRSGDLALVARPD